MERMAWRSLRAGSRLLARRIVLRVEGLEHVPANGPSVIAARHFHHLYDGCALLSAVPRPMHIMVALDWAGEGGLRRVMEAACRGAGWPIVLRPGPQGTAHNERRYLIHAVADCVTLLRAGQLLVVFPEAYPNIDPSFTPKPDAASFLPFRPGFVRLVELAERDGRTRVAIVPAGFTYTLDRRWDVTLRFGPPLWLPPDADRAAFLGTVERQVRDLSGGPNVGSNVR